ncbi:hypothetical protein [Nocardia cyriacigeorgica]|uniref:hypothetical protein n=1 Tax=Nocardia cyriacigeorgica TaxID=135487 RepID=UPI0013D69831|nr:hypothetical protein [Nocardia cyriacigeorgica]MBF6452677.1 hypothetical protein [Nocardia cyriacigeorgica]MBF6480403.1 hypothetical protein [Nocardia cyriacigeorgica]MBF6549846.1 hypothetical protein [Nocardia cyriacigeorgica]NEW29147.1 hypothetical protein [Nocardia cyriacigeorgica]
MAKRFTDAEKARAVKKVEKLRAEGKSLNAACEEVVQKAGWPSVGALTNWVKAAANGAAAEEPAAEAEAPAPRKRVVKKAPKARATTARKRAASTNGSAPKKAAPSPQAVVATAATLVAEPEPTPVVEEVTAVAEAPAADEAAQPEQREAALVAVTTTPTQTVTPVADPEFGHRSADDLANEVRRLRIALEELHGENRALKDLVGIYVRR